ncbi:MAG: hypothetical protein KF778_08405 [Rhodocyclaceae bacterium]|nr:hypothetical protein [Rhodocyclaceae bacterium]MBX3668408.1 hypothetical protein [Rhodocyclaceae bacterium]
MRHAPLLLLLLSLTACDKLGIPDAAKTAAMEEADGKAVGAACRHAGRAIEDCFTMNPKAPRSAVFAGWKDMNDYMTENKIDVVQPVVPRAEPDVKKKKRKKSSDSQTEHAGGEAAGSESEGSSKREEAPGKGAHASNARRGRLES